MPSTSIRWDVVSWVVARLRDHPTLQRDSSVDPGWPGDKKLRPSMVWVDDIDGEVSIPVATAGRKHRTDTFRVPILVRTTHGRSIDECMARLFEIVAAVEDELAEASTLEDLPGVVSAEVTAEDQTAGVTPEGPVAFARIELTIESRLT